MIIQKELINSLKINGNKIAIEHGKKRISYSRLFDNANRITKFLLKQQLKSETVIGIDLQDRSDLICALIGTTNARCVFVLLDYSLPEYRINSIIKDLNLQYIISFRESQLLANEKNITTYYFEEILAEIGEPDLRSDEYPNYDQNDSIYIYFTSGTTGTPKGIVGVNCSLLQFVRWELREFSINSESRFSQFISPYFDAFLRDIFVPLLAGGTICIPPDEEDFFSPEKLTSWIDKSKISLIHCVPSLFRVINNGSLKTEYFKHLKYILLSGEKIIPSELLNWYKLFDSRIKLFNLYGPTETTMVRSCYEIHPEDAKLAKIPIGSPIADTELLILNKDFKPCNILVPGDVYIISDYVTRGYLNAPELTHEKFLTIKTGLSKLGKTVAFKTGDKARVLTNGNIDLIGREDRQVKLRGIRIELDEIENILVLSELIKNAVVVKHTGENGDESLVTFIIKHDDLKEGLDFQREIQLYLKGYLPEYMIPTIVVVVDKYPLLSNGKIDYKELLNYLTVAAIIAPTNDLEKKLLSIWKDILGDKPISIEESFHRMGGNSLSMMRLIGRIYNEFNVRLSLEGLFNNLTIKKQAELIKTSNKDNVLVITRSKTRPAYHVSSAQERVYYNYELNKERKSYNLPVAWEIIGKFDKDKIENAFQLLIGRHEALRTEFRVENGELLQYVREVVNFNIEEIEIHNQPVDDAILKFVKPFDLGKAPLFRCGIISILGDKKVLVVDFHHIICDGLSQMNLYSDFLNFYNGDEPAPLNLQYKDFAEWEYGFKSTEEYNALREFWLRSFESGIPKLDLPTTYLDLNEVSDDGGNVIFKINRKTVKPIIELLNKEDITVFSGLFFIYYMFLSQLTGQDDIVIGIATSGRGQKELEDVVGMFVKTLPIRYRMDSNRSFKDILIDIHNHLVQAISKQAYDLADIMSELNSSRTSPIRSLFKVMFVFQSFKNKKMEVKNEDFAVYNFENSSSKYPIILYANENEDSFDFRLEYSSNYFSKSDIELLTSQFKSLTEKISKSLNARIIEIIGGSEQPTHLRDDDITFNFSEDSDFGNYEHSLKVPQSLDSATANDDIQSHVSS